jgi:aspartokinase
MAIALVVTRKFGKYSPGTRITDPKEVAAVRGTRNRANTVKVTVPDAAAKAPASAAAGSLKS